MIAFLIDILGIHDVEQGLDEAARMGREAAEEAAAEGESSDDLGGVSPPDSPIPSVVAFNLDEEFFAIASSRGKQTIDFVELQLLLVDLDSPKRFIYFIGLVDIFTYYGVKKRTASAAKGIKYGSDAENISTVKPDQVTYFIVTIKHRFLVCQTSTWICQ